MYVRLSSVFFDVFDISIQFQYLDILEVIQLNILAIRDDRKARFHLGEFCRAKRPLPLSATLIIMSYTLGKQRKIVDLREQKQLKCSKLRDKIFCYIFLDLFGNPLAQDYDYRNYVIHNIESLQRLDRRGIFIITP